MYKFYVYRNLAYIVRLRRQAYYTPVMLNKYNCQPEDITNDHTFCYQDPGMVKEYLPDNPV